MIRNITSRDPNKQALMKLTMSFFPAARGDHHLKMKQYWGAGRAWPCIRGSPFTMKGTSAWTGVLQTHLGVTGMTLRTELWLSWPGMTTDIKVSCSTYNTCVRYEPGVLVKLLYYS
jgi:hypothetical protein